MRSDDPVIRFERVTYTVGDRPIEHSMYYARAENYQFSFAVKGKLSIANSLREAQ
jgi:DNA-binding GntR family transcriptional regulator